MACAFMRLAHRPWVAAGLGFFHLLCVVLIRQAIAQGQDFVTVSNFGGIQYSASIRQTQVPNIKMSKEAFVHDGPWDSNTRSHPAANCLEDHTTNVFDKRRFDLPYSDWFTSDFIFNKSDGTTVEGGEAGWAAAAKLYEPLAS